MNIATKAVYRYEHVLQVLEQKIDSGEYSSESRLPADHELASLFGVHRLTVRKAITVLQRRGKVVSHQGRGTYVTAGAGAATKSLSILYIGDIAGRIFSGQFLSFARAASARGYRFFGVHPADFVNKTPVELADGLLRDVTWLIIDTHTGAGAAELLNRLPLPVIGVGYNPILLNRPAYFILKDSDRAMELAVGHLAARGQRRLVLVTNECQLPKEQGASPDTPHGAGPTYAAYHGALIRYGLSSELGSLIFAGNLEANIATSCNFLKEHLKDGPLAFVCYADFRAQELYAAATRLGLNIPADISIIGIGDTSWAQSFVPQLTSLNYGEEQMASLAMQLCSGPPPHQPLVCKIEPRVIERDSVARL